MPNGGVIWLTGIPAAGKTTIGREMVAKLRARGNSADMLDGDELRKTLCQDLSFSEEDRNTNVMRIAQVATLVARNHIWVVVALVSPYRAAREAARETVEKENVIFVEAHVTCSLEEAVRRDPKGLYAKAKAGEIEGFTGLDGPYEAPEHPDVVLDTEKKTLEDCVWDLMVAVVEKKAMPPVIFVGKGSSGTRLLSELGQHLDIFLGNTINETGDTMEMVDLVYSLIHEDITLPGATVHLPWIRKIAAIMFARSKAPLGTRWGWKLPETMLLVPLFLEAFPAAKVVHLVRDPRGMCLSRGPHLTARWGHHLGRRILKQAYPFANRPIEQIWKDERWIWSACSWQFQVSLVMKYGREVLGTERYLEVTYEDLCAQPQHNANRIADFLGVARREWDARIETARMNTWAPDDPRLPELWQICGSTAQEFGYEAPRL